MAAYPNVILINRLPILNNIEFGFGLLNLISLDIYTFWKFIEVAMNCIYSIASYISLWKIQKWYIVCQFLSSIETTRNQI